MGTTHWLLAAAVVYLGLQAAGCTCECETLCTRGGEVYRYTTVEIKRSECTELNDQKTDTSCMYQCID